MSWDDRWMALAEHVASWSEDRSTKVGCIIVDNRNVCLSLGWNGFPRRVNGNVDARHERPAKYKYTEHAERNAIYNAAASGNSLLGSILYVPRLPCSDCSRGIIQAGIAKLVCINISGITGGEDDAAIGLEMLTEAGVTVEYYRKS